MNQSQRYSFSEMTISFQKAFGVANSGKYRQSIPLYKACLEAEPSNFAALNNLGVAFIYVGIEDQDIEKVELGITYIKKAIEVVDRVYHLSDGYPIAESNLEWAEEEFKKIDKGRSGHS